MKYFLFPFLLVPQTNRKKITDESPGKHVFNVIHFTFHFYSLLFGRLLLTWARKVFLKSPTRRIISEHSSRNQKRKLSIILNVINSLSHKCKSQLFTVHRKEKINFIDVPDSSFVKIQKNIIWSSHPAKMKKTFELKSQMQNVCLLLVLSKIKNYISREKIIFN